MDELSPLFHDIEFNERFRGYDVEEVDAYVDRVAKAAALVQGRIAELQDRVAAAEAQPRSVAASAADTGDVDDARLSRVLVLAQRTADAAIEEAKAEADAMRLEAAADAEAARREADDHVSLVLAEAETDRRRLLAEAQESAAAAVAEERQRGAQELARLETRRTELADEITLLELHMAETRLAVAASVSALTDLL
ncbi:MAG: DivIVA domain-containing protein, partial [Actinomycetota bacterium]